MQLIFIDKNLVQVQGQFETSFIYCASSQSNRLINIIHSIAVAPKRVQKDTKKKYDFSELLILESSNQKFQKPSVTFLGKKIPTVEEKQRKFQPQRSVHIFILRDMYIQNPTKELISKRFERYKFHPETLQPKNQK
eukprot:TRINITY_DN909_c2_g1_i2.p6 TRINITY_DN909_c2_g1~~TRINITY_DN909_c2_g1_i2.p6  ORF type:complete len:136 (+),score=11.96 TRINITY_DN909_c2_g1_i2:292-699(+)